jgi:hypothetical protein
MGSWAKRSSAAVLVIACGGSAQTAVTPAGMSNADTTEGLASFAFDSLDTRPVTSNAFRGKPAVLAFVTTFDPMSQVQVNVLVALGEEVPNLQLALVALQDASARELVEIYRDAMKVKFPVALGDAATIAGGGSLGDVHRVPTTLLIDGEGRVVWRHAGAVRGDELRKQVKKLGL